MSKKLHIISFDIPYPPNYGGVIDVFFKIKALHQMGMELTLHCFQYGDRQASELLEAYCTDIFYYPRQKKWQSLPLFRPHIVESRQHTELLRNLCQDSSPILFEGLHSCYYLKHPLLKNRLKLVRMHNIEWDYYKQLANKEKSWWKKAYFTIESYQLQHFEQQLTAAQHILAISPKDNTYLQTKFPSVHYLPAFHSNEQLQALMGKGKYVLYHGNLSVNENIEAVLFLLNQVFTPNFDYPLIIAGKSPHHSIHQQIQQTPNRQLIANPSQEKLQELVQQAHIHILPTFQATGIKLKLLYALFNGRFCMANLPMVAQTGLEQACTIATTATEWQQKIKQLWTTDFTATHQQQRKILLRQNFDNQQNAEKIARLINC